MRNWLVLRHRVQLRWLHILVQVAVAGFIAYWYWQVPPPNKAVLIITGVTVIMALLEMRASHKAIYLLLVFCLMFIENRAINKDRADYTKDGSARREKENRQFQTISNRLTAAIQSNQEHFDATMNSMKTLITSTRDIATTSNQSLEQITGGNGYCSLWGAGEIATGWTLLVFNSGDLPLYDVTVRVREVPLPSDSGQEFLRKFNGGVYKNLGTIRSKKMGERSTGIKVGPDSYSVDIATRNNAFSERLDIKLYPKEEDGYREDFQVWRAGDGKLMKKCCAGYSGH